MEIDKITAKLVKPVEQGKNLSSEKELVTAWSYVVNTAKGIREPIRVRWWMSRGRNAMKVYCTIWISNGETYCAGHGSAGGCGYDKESASLDCAISAAGIRLSQSISGVGEYGSRAACEAILRAIGYRGKFYLVRHG